MNHLELSHVHKSFARTEGEDVTQALEDINFSVNDGEFLSIVGPSGCGKTTTLRMIAGLETPTTGKIDIDGVTVFDSDAGINIPPNKRRVGFLFQNYALWPNMTVYQNIAFGLSNIKEAGLSVNENGELVRNPSAGGAERKLTKEEINKIIERVSAIVKIQPFMDRYPGELSGGQQQRVAIARAITSDTELILADEPTGNLDSKNGMRIVELLSELAHWENRCVIVVTHDPTVAGKADNTLLMEDGRLHND